MVKKEPTSEIGGSDQPTTEQSKMAEVRPRKRAIKSKKSGNNPEKKQKKIESEIVSLKIENISEVEQNEEKSDSCQICDPEKERKDIRSEKLELTKSMFLVLTASMLHSGALLRFSRPHTSQTASMNWKRQSKN